VQRARKVERFLSPDRLRRQVSQVDQGKYVSSRTRSARSRRCSEGKHDDPARAGVLLQGDISDVLAAAEELRRPAPGMSAAEGPRRLRVEIVSPRAPCSSTMRDVSSSRARRGSSASTAPYRADSPAQAGERACARSTTSGSRSRPGAGYSRSSHDGPRCSSRVRECRRGLSIAQAGPHRPRGRPSAAWRRRRKRSGPLARRAS